MAATCDTFFLLFFGDVTYWLSASFVTTAPGAEGSILPCGVGIGAWIQKFSMSIRHFRVLRDVLTCGALFVNRFAAYRIFAGRLSPLS